MLCDDLGDGMRVVGGPRGRECMSIDGGIHSCTAETNTNIVKQVYSKILINEKKFKKTILQQVKYLLSL